MTPSATPPKAEPDFARLFWEALNIGIPGPYLPFEQLPEQQQKMLAASAEHFSNAHTPAVPTAGEADHAAADAYATLVAFSQEKPFHIDNLARCYRALSDDRERLRAALEPVLRLWDEWELMHKERAAMVTWGEPVGSWPRDRFECFIDGLAEDAREALRSPAASPKEG